jgi:hypothetical protein
VVEVELLEVWVLQRAKAVLAAGCLGGPFRVSSHGHQGLAG